MKTHSAIVKIEVSLHGETIKIGNLGPDLMIPREVRVDLAPGIGRTSINIDGSETVIETEFPKGIKKGMSNIPFQNRTAKMPPKSPIPA